MTLIILFGGISQFHYDKTNARLVKDPVDLDRGIDGLPFIDTVSIVTRDKAGKYAQYIWPTRLAGLRGTEARFFSTPYAPAFASGVVKLASLKGRSLVGYLYGGIEASEAQAEYQHRNEYDGAGNLDGFRQQRRAGAEGRPWI